MHGSLCGSLPPASLRTTVLDKSIQNCLDRGRCGPKTGLKKSANGGALTVGIQWAQIYCEWGPFIDFARNADSHL